MIKDIIENNDNVDVNKSKIEKLKQVIPNCFDKYGNLDIELLKKEFSDSLDFTKESFELNFLGKSYAKMVAGLDTETVIEPDIKNNLKEENKNSKNIYISGDNLDALKHLLKAYERKIKCIYIDPPYNTGSDGFVYNDTFCFSKKILMEKLDVSEEEAERIINLTSSNSSSHSAWLTFILPRIILGKNLLKENGAIFISIGEDEFSNLKLLCDNVFGEENYLTTISRLMKSGGNKGEFFSPNIDYVLVYAKNKYELEPFREELSEDLVNNIYNKIDDDGNNYREMGLYQAGLEIRPNQRYYIQCPDGSYVIPKGNTFPKRIGQCEKVIPESGDGVWRWIPERFLVELEQGNIIFKETSTSALVDEKGNKSKWNIYTKIMLNDRQETGKVPVNFIGDCENRKSSAELKELDIPFDFAKPTDMLTKLINFMKFEENDIILDYFSGSASTAHAILRLNSDEKYEGNTRRFIMVQLNEKCKENSEAFKKGYNTIDEIGQERIRRAAKQIKENTNADIDYGFKHYILKETPDDLLNKLELFKPEIVNDNYNIYKEYGIDTILETWKLKDGYEFTANIDMIDCGGYEAYKCKECLYLINPNITVKNIQALLDKYNQDDTFVCDKLVIFGYSFRFDEIEMIKNNIKQVKNFKSIDVKVYTRY